MIFINWIGIVINNFVVYFSGWNLDVFSVLEYFKFQFYKINIFIQLFIYLIDYLKKKKKEFLRVLDQVSVRKGF